MKQFLLFFSLLLTIACSVKKDTSHISDLSAFFTHCISIDSITGSNIGLGISFYNKKAAYLTKDNSSDSGTFWIIDLQHKRAVNHLKNTFYPYMNLQSYLYNDTLYFAESPHFPAYYSYDIYNKKLNYLANKNDSAGKIYGAGLSVKDSLLFFYGYPYEPSIMNKITLEKHASCDHCVISPRYAVFSQPLDSTQNLMMGCRANSLEDSIYCYSIDNNLKELWRKTIYYEGSKSLSFFKILNTDLTYVICYSDRIFSLDKSTGKTLWEWHTNKTVFGCFGQKGKLFLFKKQFSTQESDSIYTTVMNISTGQPILPSTFIGKGIAKLSQGYYSYNEKYVFISLMNNLSIYNTSEFQAVFSKDYPQPVFLENHQDAYDNRPYTVVDNHVFWQ